MEQMNKDGNFNFRIETQVHLGLSHCRPMYSDVSGSVELSSDEVTEIVNLIKSKGTSDVQELDLKNTYPEIFKKLDEAYLRISYNAEELHWLWEGYYEGAYECDLYELMDYCENECGFVFEGDDDEDDFADEDGEIDEDAFEDAKMEKFLDEWLENYIDSLDEAEQKDFLKNHMNIIVEMDENDIEYEVRIPEAIIELSKE